MKYESTILKRLIDTYGVVGNPRYISEIIKEFIVRGKERFPELFTYQADWLAHIDEFGLNPSYTVSYTGQSIYAPNTLERPVKSAILSGSTKYRDIDTGEFLETFEEGRNLELVSVKMPVLTTTGKNLFDGKIKRGVPNRDGGWQEYIHSENFIKVNSIDFITSVNLEYVTSLEFVKIYCYDENKNLISTKAITEEKPLNTKYIKFAAKTINNPSDLSLPYNVQIEYGTVPTTYEPYKSNILTVNEDVTLRSNGDICDELNLLTGQLTQRIDENNEVLSQEVIKTVDLTIHDKDHQKVERLTTFKGGTHFNTSSQDGSLLPTLTVDVVTDLEEILMVCSSEGNTM